MQTSHGHQMNLRLDPTYSVIQLLTVQGKQYKHVIKLIIMFIYHNYAHAIEVIIKKKNDIVV